MIGRGLPGYDDPLVRKQQVSLADLRGMELPDDSWIMQDQAEHSRGLLDQEEMGQEESERGMQGADREAQMSREQQILDMLQQLMAEQQVHSQGQLGREQAMAATLPSLASIMQAPMQQPAAPAQKPQQQTFGQAFAAARKAGAKTFEWRGKKYTTQLAEGRR